MKLFLQFEIGTDGYLIDAQGVVAVLPLLQLKHVPHAPAGIAGTFNYRGQSVLALDLSELALGTPAARNMSTRIILVPSGPDRLLGVIAEEIASDRPTSLHDSAVRNSRRCSRHRSGRGTPCGRGHSRRR